MKPLVKVHESKVVKQQIIVNNHFSVKPTELYNAVRVRCKYQPKSMYIIQKSSDGKLWQTVKHSFQCMMYITRLRIGKNYLRMATVNSTGQSEWSEAVVWEVY